MNTSSTTHQTLASILILGLTCAGLWSLDVQQNNIDTSDWSMGSIISTLLQGNLINNELLAQTSLKDVPIIDKESSNTFFEDYLILPEDQVVSHYALENPRIEITEIKNTDVENLVRKLVEQKKSSYSFNVINPTTFYLNQQPLSEKTHNFLAIGHENTLFGFQYHPQGHHFVLEIIDALQKNK